MEKKYRDTFHYSPVDVVKGLDLITQQIVNGDDIAPDNYPLRPKCRFCGHYKEKNDIRDGTGMCMATEYPFMAYGDMMASCCKEFQSLGAN